MCVWFDPEEVTGVTVECKKVGCEVLGSLRGWPCVGVYFGVGFLDGCNHGGHSASDTPQIQLSVFLLLLLLLLGTTYDRTHWYF